jgi:hypothetical protein
MKLMDDLDGYLSDRTPFGVYQHIGLAIVWLTSRKKLSDSCQRVRILQQRAVVMVSDPFINRIG